MKLFNPIKKMAPLGMLTVAATCATLELPGIPIAAVTSNGIVFEGTITPRTDFSSSFTIVSNSPAITCQGETAPGGVGNMSCTDGSSYDIHIPDYPSRNGSYVAGYDAGGRLVGSDEATQFVAIGHGREASPAHLRGKLP